MDPDCFAQASTKLVSILEGKTVESSDYIIFAKDGTLRYIETNATPVLKNGRIFCIVCVARDITRRKMIFKDGTRRIFWLQAKRMYYEGRKCIVGTGTDITDQKRVENDLKRFAENLQDANIALRVLMHQRNEDQKDIEEKLQAHVNDLILPHLRKLKQANLEDRHKNHLQILEHNLREILSPFMKNIHAAHADLTPREIQIMDLIKKGKNNGDIAAMLNASLKTVETHRNHIREKLNLVHARVNLRSYLLSMS